MIGFSKIAYEALKPSDDEKFEMNLLKWWKKSKLATVYVFFVFILEIPFMVARYIIMAVCFIPHKIYEELESSR